MTDKELVRRAEEAQLLLDNAVWKELKEAQLTRYRTAMEEAPNVEQTQNAKLCLVLAKEMWQQAEQYVQQGKFAADLIKQEESRLTLFARTVFKR